MAMTVRALRRIAVLALPQMRVFRRRNVDDQRGSISLELLLATPVLMFTVTFVVWAGASGRAHLVSDLAAEEGAAVAANCMAAGESNIDPNDSPDEIREQRSANEEQCNQMVSDMLETRSGLAELCIGGASGNDGDNRGDESPFLQTVKGDRFSPNSEDDIDVLEVEHRCETDGAIGSLFGLYPSIAFRGHGSEIISVRGTPPPPNSGGNQWTCENRDPEAELSVVGSGMVTVDDIRRVVIMEPPRRAVEVKFQIKDLALLPCGSQFRVTTRSLNTFGCEQKERNCDFLKMSLSGKVEAGIDTRRFGVELYNDNQAEGIEKFQILIAYVPFTEANKKLLDEGEIDSWTPRNMTADLPNIVIEVVIVDGDHEDYDKVGDYDADAPCDPNLGPDGSYFVADEMTVEEGDGYVQILDELKWLPCGTSYFTRAYSGEGVVGHETINPNNLNVGDDYGYDPELLGTPRPDQLRDGYISGSDDGVVLIYDDEIYEDDEQIDICLWRTPLALPSHYTRKEHKPKGCITLTIEDDQDPNQPCDPDYGKNEELRTVFSEHGYELDESGISPEVVLKDQFWTFSGSRAYFGMLPCDTVVEVSIGEDRTVTIISDSISSDLGNDDGKVIEFASTNEDPPSPQFKVVSGGTMDPSINLYIRNNDDGLNANEEDETLQILVDVIEVPTYSTLELGTRGILTITIEDDVDPPK